MKYTKISNNVLYISIILNISGLCLIVSRSLIFDCLLSLECNPILFYIWKTVPFDIQTEFYLFNWTNPQEIYNVSVKPKFEEIGPFVFHMKEEKCNIVWNDNGTVTFEQRRFWYFDESKSLSLETKITNVDIIFLSLCNISRMWNYYVRKGLLLSLSPYFPNIYKTHSAKELLFDGYPEPMLMLASGMPFFADLNIPHWNKFGWMYTRNDSSEFDGIFNMGTGSNSVLGRLYNWNYQQTNKYFENECSKISGSASELYPRNLTRDDPIEIFSTDLRRSLFLKFVQEESVKNIPGYRYAATNYALDNGTINPKNKCFCPDECTPSGVVNISMTRHNSPIFVSLPHFYGADPYYLNLVDGLKPEKEKHDAWLTLEPVTGTILKASPKLQINLLMQPTVTGTKLFEATRKIYFPVVWFHVKTTIPDREALLVKFFLAFPTGSVCLGVLMIVTGMSLLFYKGINYRRRLNSLRKVQVGETLKLKDST